MTFDTDSIANLEAGVARRAAEMSDEEYEANRERERAEQVRSNERFAETLNELSQATADLRGELPPPLLTAENIEAAFGQPRSVLRARARRYTAARRRALGG